LNNARKANEVLEPVSVHAFRVPTRKEHRMRESWRIAIPLTLLALGGCANESSTSSSSQLSESASAAPPASNCGVNTAYAGDSPPAQATAQR